MEFYERRKAMGVNVNPTKVWGEINREWEALSQDRRGSYMAEASMGLTQAARKARRIVPLQLASPMPLASSTSGDALVSNRKAIVSFEGVGACMAARAISGDSLLQVCPASSSALPLDPPPLARSLSRGANDKSSLMATVGAFEALHSHIAKPAAGFPAEIEFPGRASGAWDRPGGQVPDHRSEAVRRISELLGRAAKEVGKPAEVFSAEALLAVERTFKSMVCELLDTQTVVVHLASASAQAGVLRARQNFIVCQPIVAGDASKCANTTVQYARRPQIACPPLPWAGGSLFGYSAARV